MSFLFREINDPAAEKLSDVLKGVQMQKVIPLDYRKVPFTSNKYKPPHCVLPE